MCYGCRRRSRRSAAIVGGQIGAWMLQRVNETWLRIGVVVIGLLLTVGLFLRLP